MTVPQRRIFLLLAAGLVVWAITPWTDFVGHPHWDDVQWIPFVTPPIRAIDVLGNVVLFVPLGVAIASIWPDHQLLRAGTWALLMSVAGEWAQLYSHNRFPSTTDILCNFVGALIGVRLLRAATARSR